MVKALSGAVHAIQWSLKKSNSSKNTLPWWTNRCPDDSCSFTKGKADL